MLNRLSSFAEIDPFIRKLDSSSDCEEQEKPVKQVNEYVLLRPLGEGSYAKVFLALDTLHNRHYAIKRFKLKELQHKDAGVSQLEREISAMRKIVHPNIIHLHRVLHAETTDTVYLVIDYADCGSLESVLEKQKLDDNALKYIFSKVLSAVSYLHSQGVVHQDIKPSNILLGSGGEVYLSDFGVGHSFQSTAMVVGSPAYQAPEALDGEGEWDPVTLNPAEEDVWSLGVTLYECLFQDLPFKGENVFEIIQNIRQTPLVIPPGATPDVVTLLRGMLAVDPNERFTVEQVMQSSFLRDVPAQQLLPFASPEDKTVPTEVQRIHATVCDVNYSFARPTLTAHELLRTKIPPVSFAEAPRRACYPCHF